MSRNKFILIFVLPYVFIILCLFLAKPLGSLLYKSLATPQELRIVEYPFRFEVPDIKKPVITSELRPPFKIPGKEPLSIGHHKPQQLLLSPPIPSPPATIPKVTLVMVSERLRIAIINDILLREGDTFDNGVILRIRDDAVVISEKGRLTEISVEGYKP
jgi:hypothetical protein